MEKFSVDKKNINLIKWSMVLSPINKGDLDINSVQSTNFALLSKWTWIFYEEKNHRWKCIIIAKYEQSYLGEFPTKSKYSSSKAPWMSIIKGADWVLPQIKWTIKRGDSLSFWHSRWHDLSPFTQSNPRLFALSTRKGDSIANMWNAETADCDLYPRRPLRSVEEVLWDDMKASPPLPDSGFDNPRWILNNNGSFTMASIKLARPPNNQDETNEDDG